MKVKKERSILLLVLLCCVALYFLYSLSSLWVELINGKETLADYNKQIAQTERDIEEYQNLLAAGNEVEIVKKAARERLGYVFRDEQVFIDVSGS